MWEKRNGELHNPESPASLREHARLDALIQLEYANQLSLAIQDRRWFKRPHEVIFTETIEYKLQWLESVRLARAKYAWRLRHDLTRERSAMRRYLRRTRPTR